MSPPAVSKNGVGDSEEQHFIVETETVEAPVASTLLSANAPAATVNNGSGAIVAGGAGAGSAAERAVPPPAMHKLMKSTESIVSPTRDTSIHQYIQGSTTQPAQLTTTSENGSDVAREVAPYDGSGQEPPLANVDIVPDSKVIPSDSAYVQDSSELNNAVGDGVATNNLIDNNPLSVHAQNQSSSASSAQPLKNKKSSLLIESTASISPLINTTEQPPLPQHPDTFYFDSVYSYIN